MDEDVNKLEKSKLVKLIAIICVIGFGCLMVGIAMGDYFAKMPQQNNQVTGLSDLDKNFLIGLAYQTNHCERLGLVSRVIIETLPDTNISYGRPICIEAPQVIE